MEQKHPHDYFIETKNRLPTSNEFYAMQPAHLDCDHKEIQDGFGLAGGGFGHYIFCNACERMLAKDQESDEE